MTDQPDMLEAQKFAADPRVAQAKALLHEALAEHQLNLTGERPPDPARKIQYQQWIDQLSHLRGGKLYYPYLASGLGNGALVELADGSVKYDMITGIGVHYFGHSHPEMIDTMIDAALADTIMQGNLQQNLATLELSQTFVDLARSEGSPEHKSRIEHCFLSTSGAMANENALKIIFQKHHPADRVIAFKHCFMGRTLALAQITDREKYRLGLPPTLLVDYIPFFEANDPQGSTRRAVDALNEHLRAHPDRHAAMCFELVQGEGGYYPGDKDFFIALMSTAKEHGLAIMCDEIQTFGRTTSPFAFQYFGLDDYVDVVTVGKMTHVCATLFTDAYRAKPGLVSQTFTGSTAAILAALKILNTLGAGPLTGPEGRIAQIHQKFVEHFQRIGARHKDCIRGPYGIGGMIAFTPFDGSMEKAGAFVKALFENGVIGFVAGGSGGSGGEPARIRFLPPLAALKDQDIDHVCRILEQTFEQLA